MVQQSSPGDSLCLYRVSFLLDTSVHFILCVCQCPWHSCTLRLPAGCETGVRGQRVCEGGSPLSLSL